MSVVKIYATPNFFFSNRSCPKAGIYGQSTNFHLLILVCPYALMHAAFKFQKGDQLFLSKTVSDKLHVLYMCLTDSLIKKFFV